MSVCPFCKAPVPSSQAPCPRCGKLASDHPSIAGTAGRTLGNDWDEDDVPDLGLDERGHAPTRGGPSLGPAPSNPYEGGGLTLDDDFDDPMPAGSLELDMPMGHAASMARPSGAVPGPPPDPSLPPSSSTSRAPLPATSGPPAAPPSSSRAPSHAVGALGPSNPSLGPASGPIGQPQGAPPAAPTPPAPPDPAALVARFPAPPTAVWQAPAYALKVLWRQLEIRQDLTSLRRRRSPDVPLYERALKTHDPKAFALGLALTGAVVVVMSFLFFLPVILRFVRAPE